MAAWRNPGRYDLGSRSAAGEGSQLTLCRMPQKPREKSHGAVAARIATLAALAISPLPSSHATYRPQMAPASQSSPTTCTALSKSPLTLSASPGQNTNFLSACVPQEEGKSALPQPRILAGLGVGLGPIPQTRAGYATSNGACRPTTWNAIYGSRVVGAHHLHVRQPPPDTDPTPRWLESSPRTSHVQPLFRATDPLPRSQ
jgi:hypothetical protein